MKCNQLIINCRGKVYNDHVLRLVHSVELMVTVRNDLWLEQSTSLIQCLEKCLRLCRRLCENKDMSYIFFLNIKDLFFFQREYYMTLLTHWVHASLEELSSIKGLWDRTKSYTVCYTLFMLINMWTRSGCTKKMALASTGILRWSFWTKKQELITQSHFWL